MNIVFYFLVGAALVLLYFASSKLFFEIGDVATKSFNKVKENINKDDEKEEEEINE